MSVEHDEGTQVQKDGLEGITVTQSVELKETNRSDIAVDNVAESWDERARNMRTRDASIDREGDYRARWMKKESSEEDLVGY
jgi:hypothetical protein